MALPSVRSSSTLKEQLKIKNSSPYRLSILVGKIDKENHLNRRFCLAVRLHSNLYFHIELHSVQPYHSCVHSPGSTDSIRELVGCSEDGILQFTTIIQMTTLFNLFMGSSWETWHLSQNVSVVRLVDNIFYFIYTKEFIHLKKYIIN